MAAGASLRELARTLGVSEKAVRKAEQRGVFQQSVQRQDGAPVVVDLTLAIAEWVRAGRQLRGMKPPRGAAPAEGARVTTSAPGAEEGTAAVAPTGDEDLDDETDEELAQLAATPSSLVGAQRITMLERARKLKLENDLRERQLVEVDQASREAFEFARTVRENVLNIPARISAELAAESDQAKVFARLDAALREALETTAAQLEAGAVDEKGEMAC